MNYDMAIVGKSDKYGNIILFVQYDSMVQSYIPHTLL